MAKKNYEQLAAVDVRQIHGPQGTGLLKSAGFIHRQVIPSGLLAFDMITPGKGIPVGRWTSIYGDYNSGKSTLIYRTMANAAVRYNMPCVIIDTESRYEPEIAQLNGLPIDSDLVSLMQWEPVDPTSPVAEGKLRATIQSVARFIRDFGNDSRVLERVNRHTWAPCEADDPDATCRGGVIAIDSLNMFMTSDKETVLPEANSSLVFAVPKILSQAGGEWLGIFNSRNIAFITTTQIRDNVSLTFAKGPTTIAPMGKAAKFMPSIMAEFKYVGRINSSGKDEEKDELAYDEYGGRKIRITATKNTGGRYAYAQEYVLTNGAGPDDVREALEYGETFGLVKKAGAFYTLTYSGQTLKSMQGINAVREWFDADPLRLAEFREEVRQKMLQKDEEAA